MSEAPCEGLEWGDDYRTANVEMAVPGVSEVPCCFWLITDSSQTTGRVDGIGMACWEVCCGGV